LDDYLSNEMNKQLKPHIMYQNGSCITLHKKLKYLKMEIINIHKYVGFA